MDIKICTLKNKPELYRNVIELIETGFTYPSEHSFERDFYPLMNKNNWHNCYILHNEKEVISHIGVSERKISAQRNYFKASLLGGIATSPKYRGKGYFRTLLSYVLDATQDSCFQILWSDNSELYKKYNFHLCSEQYLLEKDDTNESTGYEQTVYEDLTISEREEIQQLYQLSIVNSFVTCTRTRKEWGEISRITSSELYIKKENEKIIEYFFMNKGADLSGIVHEIASLSKPAVKEISHYGSVWLPRTLKGQLNLTQQYGFHLKIGDYEGFTLFVSAMTDGLIKINTIEEDIITFTFNNRVLEDDHQNFLSGIMGPNIFSELEGQYPLFYISGLDSI